MFSNAYTNVNVDTWRTSWSVATLNDIQIDTNDVKKYTALDYAGVETVTNKLNVTAMDTFEFDLWTPNSTTFKYKLVDFGADGAFGGGDDKEHELTLTPTLNTWNHVAVSLSDFTGLTTKANIAQLVFASVPSGTSIVYIDNVLFSKKMQTGLASVKSEKVGVYPNPANKSFTITSTNAIQNITIYNALGQAVLNSLTNSNNVSMDIATLPNGIYTIKVTINGVDTFNKLVKE